MASSLTFVMRETLPYIWWKHRLQALPQKHLVSPAVEATRRAVYVESFLAAHVWEPYLRQHFKRMSENQRSFGRYTLFACCLEYNKNKNPYDRYIKILALAVYIALYCNARGRPQGITLLPYILGKFIEVELSDTPVDDEFWNNLVDHVIRQDYLESHLLVDKMVHKKHTKKEILHALTDESTVQELHDPAQRIANIKTEFIETYYLTEEILCSLDMMVQQPEPPEKYAVKKMTLAQKREILASFNEKLNRCSMKLFGFAQLFAMAENSVNFQKYWQESVNAAHLIEEVPDRVILERMQSLAPEGCN